MGTPGAQSHLPWPFETSGYWGVLSQVATAGHAVPPRTSMLTPGGVCFLDPMFLCRICWRAQPTSSFSGVGAGRATQARLVNRDVVLTWFPAAFPGSEPLLTRGHLCLRQVGGTQGSCSLRRAGADLEPVPGSRPCLLGPSGTRALPPFCVGSRGCLVGKRLAFGQRGLGRVSARCSLGMGQGLRRWGTGQACSSQNLSSSSGSHSPAAPRPLWASVSTSLNTAVRRSRAPRPSPSHHVDRLAVFSA